MVNGWKVTAIIFIILFTLLLSFFVLGYVVVILEEKDLNKCYYEICEEYPQAELKDGVCFCYEYDLLGELKLARTRIMK